MTVVVSRENNKRSKGLERFFGKCFGERKG